VSREVLCFRLCCLTCRRGTNSIGQLVKQLFFRRNRQEYYRDRRELKTQNSATAQSAAEGSGRSPPVTASNINLDPPTNATAQATADNRHQSSLVPDRNLGLDTGTILTASEEPTKSDSSIEPDNFFASEHATTSTIAKRIPDCHSDASLRQGFEAIQGNPGHSSSSVRRLFFAFMISPLS
jgi:hypothetical protein